MDQKKTLTREQRVILLVGNWLKRFSQIYPMYGKTLDELPERLEAFLDEFRNENPDELDRAFRAVRGTCTEFPTPSHVRAQLIKSPVRIQHERLLVQSSEILARADKPPNWEPLTEKEKEYLHARIRAAATEKAMR